MNGQEKYPVVACTLVYDFRDSERWIVDDAAPVGSVPPQARAVAIPLALLENYHFREAVMDRWDDDKGAWYLFDALAAELRSRAGIGEGEK